jgi:dephospho-CoA kinase
VIVVGVTGSIAAGKSTVANAFAAFGAAVFDADAEVWRFYQGDGFERIRALFPGAVVDGRIDRARLSALVGEDRSALKALEAVAHPAVAARRRSFLDAAEAKGVRVAVAEIPLLFETGGESQVDVVLVVDAPVSQRRERALLRPRMTPEKFDAIEARQTSPAEKRRRAHFIIDAVGAIEATQSQALAFLRALAADPGRPRHA